MWNDLGVIEFLGEVKNNIFLMLTKFNLIF